MQTKGNLSLPVSRAQLNEVANVILRCGNINKQYVKDQSKKLIKSSSNCYPRRATYFFTLSAIVKAVNNTFYKCEFYL